MKRIITVIVLLFVFSFSVSADVYTDQYNASGAEKLYESLPEDTKEIFDRFGIDPSQNDWVNSINTGNIFTLIKEFIASGGRVPLMTGAALMALILIISAFNLFCEREDAKTPIDYISALSVSAVALVPVFTVISSAARSIKAGAQFMLSFVPIYGAVLFASGKPVTSAASGTLLLAASEGLIQLSSYVITPLVGSYMALCLCSSLTPIINNAGLAELIKKAANWIIGLISTVYLGVLSFQTTVNSAADTLAVRTGKFIVGSFVPVVGGAVSEALTTVQSCVGMLRTSVGIYGAVALALILLPVIIELLLWRAVLLICASVSSVFESNRIGALLRSADAAVSFLLGIMLLCGLAFIVSITVITSAGG